MYPHHDERAVAAFLVRDAEVLELARLGVGAPGVREFSQFGGGEDHAAVFFERDAQFGYGDAHIGFVVFRVDALLIAGNLHQQPIGELGVVFVKPFGRFIPAVEIDDPVEVHVLHFVHNRPH